MGLLNGALWGTLVGLFATLVYRSLALGAVMTTAVLFNLLNAAIVGVIVPLVLARAGRDPAQGSSVMLTSATDCMGSFLFLGLADVSSLSQRGWEPRSRQHRKGRRRDCDVGETKA